MFFSKFRNLHVLNRYYRCYQSIIRPVIVSKFSTHSGGFFEDDQLLEVENLSNLDSDDMDNGNNNDQSINFDNFGGIDNLLNEVNFINKKMENKKIEESKDNTTQGKEKENIIFDKINKVDLSHNRILTDFEALQAFKNHDKSREKELEYSLVIKPLINTHDSSELITLANKFKHENNITMARLYFKYATNSSPYKPQPYQAWSNFEYNLGHYNEARKIYASGISTILSIESDTNLQKALYIITTWAGMERKLRQYDRARELYMNCISILPNEKDAWIKWSDMELVLGNIDRFRKIMESYLYKYSEDPLDWVDYSKSLQKYSLHGTALSILQQAYKKYSDDANVIIALAELYEKTNQKEKSEELYSKSLSNNPNNVPVLLKMASSAEKNGQIEKARKYYQNIINQQYNTPEVWSRLGILEYQQHNDKPAKICFKTASKLEPTDPIHFVNWALVEFREGSNERAEELLTRAEHCEELSKSADMAISCLRGRILARQFKYKEAEDVFIKAIDDNMRNVNAYYHYAEDVLIPQKKWREAIDQLTQCRDLIRDPSKNDFINSKINECMIQLKGSPPPIKPPMINSRNIQRQQYPTAQANLDLSSILNQKNVVNNINNKRKK